MKKKGKEIEEIKKFRKIQVPSLGRKLLSGFKSKGDNHHFVKYYLLCAEAVENEKETITLAKKQKRSLKVSN